MAKPEPGVLLDARYELVQASADRGLGESWQAQDTQHNARVVGVKLLRPLAPGASMPRDLAEHFKTLRAFRHENVLSVINHGVWEQRPYLVHDRFEGRSIGAALDEVRRAGEMLAPALLEAVFDGACRAVHAGHKASRPVLHLGVTPGCVLYRGEGPNVAVCVVDFGLARHAGPDPTAPVRSARALVSPAPEQLAADGAVGPATDVFGLGGLLRELLSVPPSLGATLAPAGFERRRDDVPDALWEVSTRAMSPRPEDRYASVEALREAAARAWREPVVVAIKPLPAAPAAPVVATSARDDAPPERVGPTVDALSAHAALEGRVRVPAIHAAIARPAPTSPSQVMPFPVREAAPRPRGPLAASPDDALLDGSTTELGDAAALIAGEPTGVLDVAPSSDEPREYSRTITADADQIVAAIAARARVPTAAMPPREVADTQEVSEGLDALLHTVAVEQPHEDPLTRTLAVDEEAPTGLRMSPAFTGAATPSGVRPTPAASFVRPPTRPQDPAPLAQPTPTVPAPPPLAPAPPPLAPASPAKVAAAPGDPTSTRRYALIVAVGILFIPVLLGILLLARR